jgi:hypothetical protein
MEDKTPENIEALKKKAADKSSYKTRLEVVDELGKYKCRQSIDILWRLMMQDKVYAVQEASFRKLQALGETVKLPRKQKGHLIKDINQKLGVVERSMPASYSQADFNKKFQELYPEAFDIYTFEKNGQFESWIQNVLNALPKK